MFFRPAVAHRVSNRAIAIHRLHRLGAGHQPGFRDGLGLGPLVFLGVFRTPAKGDLQQDRNRGQMDDPGLGVLPLKNFDYLQLSMTVESTPITKF